MMRILLKIFGLIKVSLIIAYCFISTLLVEGKSLPKTGELDNSIYFNIYIDKTDYLESEPIWLTSDIIFDKSMKLDREPVLYPSNDLRLILLDSKGDTLKYSQEVIVYAILKKDYPDTMFYLHNLLDTYGERDKLPNSKAGWSFFLPSEQYSLTAVLHLRIGGESRFFNSNTVFFSVTKPSGEELEAYNKLLELQVLRSDPTRNLEKVTESVEEFVNTYPNSAYVEKTRSIMLTAGLIRDNIIEYLKTVISDKPNNGYNYYYLGHMAQFCERIGKSEIFKLFVDDIVNLFSGTLLEKIVRYKLND